MRAREVKLQTRALVTLLYAELATKRIRLDVVDEGAPPVDLDDGKELAVPRLELGIPRDVDLRQLEFDLGTDAREHPPSRVA